MKRVLEEIRLVLAVALFRVVLNVAPKDRYETFVIATYVGALMNKLAGLNNPMQPQKIPHETWHGNTTRYTDTVH